MRGALGLLLFSQKCAILLRGQERRRVEDQNIALLQLLTELQPITLAAIFYLYRNHIHPANSLCTPIGNASARQTLSDFTLYALYFVPFLHACILSEPNHFGNHA